MTFPVPRAEFERRHKECERSRGFFSVFGYGPLLLLYVLTHTKFLRQYVPESKGMAVVVLIVIPFAWFALVLLTGRWLMPRRYGLLCPQCDRAFSGDDYKAARDSGHCPGCGRQILSDDAQPPAAN